MWEVASSALKPDSSPQQAEGSPRREGSMTGQLEITTVSRCVIDCEPMCPQRVLAKALDHPALLQLKLEDFKLALSTIPPDVSIAFSGFSEPFLNPKALDMMEYARTKGHPLRLFTTLVGLTPEGVERVRNVAPEKVVLHLPDPNGIAKIPDTTTYREVLNLFHRRVHVTGWNQMGDYFKSNGRAGNCTNTKPINVKGPLLCHKLDNPEFVMLPDLRLTLCCQTWNLDPIVGSLRTQTWTEIVNSGLYQTIRHESRGWSGATSCRKCLFAIPVASEKGTRTIVSEALIKIRGKGLAER